MDFPRGLKISENHCYLDQYRLFCKNETGTSVFKGMWKSFFLFSGFSTFWGFSGKQRAKNKKIKMIFDKNVNNAYLQAIFMEKIFQFEPCVIFLSPMTNKLKKYFFNLFVIGLKKITQGSN